MRSQELTNLTPDENRSVFFEYEVINNKDMKYTAHTCGYLTNFERYYHLVNAGISNEIIKKFTRNNYKNKWLRKNVMKLFIYASFYDI